MDRGASSDFKESDMTEHALNTLNNFETKNMQYKI